MSRKTLSTRDRARIFAAHNGICHLCGGRIQAGERWEVSHPIPLEMGGADDDTNRMPAHYKCHRTHTAEVDVPQIAKAKRREAKHIGAYRTSRPLPGSRASGLRKKMNGTVEKR